VHLLTLIEDDDTAEDLVDALGAPLEALDTYGGLTAVIDRITFTIEVDDDSGMWALWCADGTTPDQAIAALTRVYPDIPLIARICTDITATRAHPHSEVA